MEGSGVLATITVMCTNPSLVKGACYARVLSHGCDGLL